MIFSILQDNNLYSFVYDELYSFIYEVYMHYVYSNNDTGLCVSYLALLSQSQRRLLAMSRKTEYLVYSTQALICNEQ